MLVKQLVSSLAVLPVTYKFPLPVVRQLSFQHALYQHTRTDHLGEVCGSHLAVVYPVVLKESTR